MNSATSKIVSVLLIVCVAASLMTIAFHMLSNKYKTETAILATAENSAVFKGVYIRSEEVVTYGGEGAVSYCVSDGGKLGNGSAIAQIYNDESQIDIQQKLKSLHDELAVLEKIQNPGTIKSAQPANISALIGEKYKNVVDSRETGDLDELSDKKSELLVLMSTYQLLTDAQTNFKERIDAIKSEITRLEASETVPVNTITSAHSAYFVSYADGYENELKPDALDSITPEIINDVQDSGPMDDKKIIGKLINSYDWYIAGVINNEKTGFAVDDDVNVNFQSTSDVAQGIVYDVRDTDDPSKKLIIIKCDEMTYDLVQHRTERVEVVSGDGESKGIKVPRKAIRFVDTESEDGSGQTEKSQGVWVKLGERVSFKKIDVIYEGTDYVLSNPDAESDYLALYDDIVVDGVENNES